MTDAPERIWASVYPLWHDGETGEDFVGGQFDAGHFKDGTEYIRADLHAELVKAADELAEALEYAEECYTATYDTCLTYSRELRIKALTAYKQVKEKLK